MAAHDADPNENNEDAAKQAFDGARHRMTLRIIGHCSLLSARTGLDRRS
jgi:hypothetical protein